ncbi:hypothetical protein [Streptomyces griseorubiginosus]|nr:hypothetical protein [Streptomyces griseorubiginosus]
MRPVAPAAGAAALLVTSRRAARPRRGTPGTLPQRNAEEERTSAA